MSIEYMRSAKFFAADGGWNRIVWVPKEVKEKVKDFIPADVVDKIATEEDAKTSMNSKLSSKQRTTQLSQDGKQKQHQQQKKQASPLTKKQQAP
jgi:acetyl-CoA decarbonylase/synthase, CODH/ACS complex subunit beta